MKKVSFMNAIRDGIAEEMRRDPDVIILGEGIGERGGSYGHTKGLWQEFGGQRVVDTPISENGFTGLAVGAAGCGLRPIVDIMFADIVYEIMSQICQQASKLCYMSGGRIPVPLVIRAQMGARITGPHHSACLYPLFMHIPGFKVVVPSNAYEAKGLMKTAIRDPNPVMMFEHKFAYSRRGEVPEDEYLIPFGKANIVRSGSEVTVIAIGPLVEDVLDLKQKELIKADIELIDPRTLWPLDMKTIIDSVRKTHRLVIVEEAHLNCNAGSEITTRLCEIDPSLLSTPIRRIAAENVPHPYSPVLENAMMPNTEKIISGIDQVMSN